MDGAMDEEEGGRRKEEWKGGMLPRLPAKSKAECTSKTLLRNKGSKKKKNTPHARKKKKENKRWEEEKKGKRKGIN